MNEREIFQAALDIETPSDRARFLDQACESRPELRGSIESLLKHFEDAGSFLERPPAELERTRLFDEQATDDKSLLPGATTPEGLMSDEALRRYFEPSDIPGVMGVIGQYEILEKVGQGGMGVVLKAKDTKLHRIVAIKLLAPELALNPMARKRFLREAQAAAAVTHDHVVRIYAVSDSPRIPMLVMEFIEGQSLQQKIDRTGALEVKEILRIGMQAALGLAAAHKQGLVHRDIKPANILLENGIQRVKITDFGLARAVDDIGITQTGQITGTPQYMSPEQAQGETVDSRSDLFSLGSVLYAMCTGRAAFRADSTVAVLRRVCDDQPRAIREINSEIPPVLADIVESLMEKNPDDRFQSAEDVADLLSQELALLQQPRQASPVALPRAGRFPLAKPPAESNRRFAWGKGLLVAGFVVLGLLGISEATGVTRIASTIIRVVSGDGTLVIETNDPSIQVAIEGQGKRQDVRITGMGVNLTLKPGQYRITATKDDRPIREELVNVTRNGKQFLRILVEAEDSEGATGLSRKLQQELELAIKLGRGELSPEELKTLKSMGHKLPELRELSEGEKILKLLAELPAQSLQELIDEGYLKWPHAGLNDPYRNSFTEVVQLFLNEAKKRGFVGKQTSLVSTRELLKNADVGFAALDFQNSQKAITFYVLMPHSPVPIGMPIVPENPRDWDSLELGLEQFDQLKKLSQKPNSFYPPPVAGRVVTPVLKDSLAFKSQLVFAGGFRPVWTPDGEHLLSSQYGIAPLQIHDLKTGEAKPFLTLAELAPETTGLRNLLDTAISPDGKTVALVLRPLERGNQVYFEEEVWVVPFTGGPGRKIAQGGFPTFGNDSDLLYFQDRKRNMLCSVRLNDSQAHPRDVLPCPAWYPAVSPDGQWVAYAVGNRLEIASFETRQVLARWSLTQNANGMLLSWSPDSRFVGLCPYEGQSHLGFWCYDMNAKNALHISDEPIGEVAWSPDGTRLAYTLHKGPSAIYVIDTIVVPNLPSVGKLLGATNVKSSLTPLAEVRQFRGHTGPVKQVAFSPDGKLAVSGSGWPNGDKTVRLWDVELGSEIRTLGKLPWIVMSVCFSPDGTQVAAGGFGGEVCVWDVSSGEKTATLPSLTEVVEDLEFSPDGQSLLGIGHKRRYASLENPAQGLGQASLWNLADGQPLWQTENAGWLTTGTFSPDGQRVYLAGFFTGAEVHVVDGKTGEKIERLGAEPKGPVEVEKLAVSPDGRFLATASIFGMIRVWDLIEGKGSVERQLEPNRLLTVAFTPDGTHILAGGHAGRIHIVDSKTLEPVVSQRHPSGSVWSLAAAPDGEHLLSAGGSSYKAEQITNNGDYVLRLWRFPKSGSPDNSHSSISKAD